MANADLETFRRAGFLRYGQVLSAAKVAALAARVDEIATGQVSAGRVRDEQTVPEGVSQRDRVWQIVDAHRDDALIWEVCTDPTILAAVADLLPAGVRLYSDQVLMKPARHGSAIAWHQDYPYWPFARPELITCWLAIDDATLGNGCMRVIAGSHRRGVLPSREDKRLADQASAEREQQVAVELPAGHCMFHHCLTLHASSPNTSPDRRRAIAITYMPADLEWLGAPRDAFPLVIESARPGAVG